jgi:hypothetical protein
MVAVAYHAEAPGMLSVDSLMKMIGIIPLKESTPGKSDKQSDTDYGTI